MQRGEGGGGEASEQQENKIVIGVGRCSWGLRIGKRADDGRLGRGSRRSALMLGKIDANVTSFTAAPWPASRRPGFRRKGRLVGRQAGVPMADGDGT